MLGFSLYLNEDEKIIEKIIKEFKDYDILFTSMHYPVDERNMKKLKFLKKLADDLKIKICLDINGEVLENYKQLLEMNLILRLDFGVEIEKIAKLSKTNEIAINASTISYENLKKLEKLGANFENMSAWHNYYPLKYSALSSKDFIEKNKMLEEFSLEIFAFFNGETNLRGPMYETLPSLEEDRNENPYYAYLKLKRYYKMKNVILSEGISNKNKKYIEDYEKNKIINLDAKLYEGYEKLKFIDVREDISEYLIRNKREYKKIENIDNKYVKKAHIVILNKNALRYSGEIEIIRKDIGIDSSRNIIGEVLKEHIKILDLIKGDDKIAINRIKK